MRLARRISSLLLASFLVLPLVGCGDDDPGGGNGNNPDDVNQDGTDHQYVMDQILLPTNATESNMYGLNLDDDPQDRPDNALGSILSALAGQSPDLDLQATLDEQVLDGDIIILSNVKTTGFSTATGVGAWIYLGDNPSTDPCEDENDTVCGRHLDGQTSFDLHAESPRGVDALLVGQIVGGKLTAGPGRITVDVSLVEGGDSLRLNLVGARVEVSSIDENGMMEGKLGGAITEDELDNSVLPALVNIIGNVVDESCDPNNDPCCIEGSTGETLLELFDEDKDCEVTLTELKNNSLIDSLLSPDVDLFDCPSEGAPINECTFDPRRDEIEDSLSLGLGFSGVPADFTPVTGID